MLLYLLLSPAVHPDRAVGSAGWGAFFAMLPYISVLVLALCGLNVMAVLILGTAFAGVIGMANGSFDLWGFLGALGSGHPFDVRNADRRAAGRRTPEGHPLQRRHRLSAQNHRDAHPGAAREANSAPSSWSAS